MKRNPHTFINLYGTIHRFRKKNKRLRKNLRGTYDIYRCEVCGISDNRYGESTFISITKLYGQHKFSKCNLKEMTFKNPAGQYVKICSKMIPCNPHPEEMLIFPDYRDCKLKVGTVHQIINPADTDLKNDHRGVWVKGLLEPVKLFNHEFIYYIKSRRTRFTTARKRGRTNFNTPKKRGGRTKF